MPSTNVICLSHIRATLKTTMPQFMWNTSFSEVVIIYKYLSPLESFIILQFNSPTHWPHCSLQITTQHLHPQTGQRLECQLPFVPSPVWLVCLFCVMSSRKINHEQWITYLQSSYGFATFLFCLTGSSELCQSVPICHQSCGETLSHPAPCSMHVFVSKLLWALARVHNVIEGLRLQNIGYDAD